jgi:hypothetical protein
MENQCYCLVTNLPKSFQEAFNGVILEPYIVKVIIEKYLLIMTTVSSTRVGESQYLMS